MFPGVLGAAALVVGIWSASAGAAIDQVSGQFELLASPPASVQPGALSSETVMRAFDERQHVTLAAPLAVNISQPGSYKLVSDETPAVIPAGTIVNSQFVHVDKDTTFSTVLTGTIHVDSDILGIVMDNAASQLLDASDYLGSPTTLYPAPDLFGRGFELNTNQQDKIVVHDDRRTVDITSDIRRQLVDQLRIITVGNEPPVVDAGPPVSGVEGSPIALAGSVSDPDGPASNISWTYTAGPGVDPGATCSFADASAPATSITCTDDGTYFVTLTDDDTVNPPVSSTTTVTVSNAPPTVTIASPADGSDFLVGSPVSVSAPFTDPGRNDTHTCSIDWGDGTTDAGAVTESNGSGSCTGSHTYAAAGSRTIAVTVTDDDGGAGTASVTLSGFGFAPGGGAFVVGDESASGTVTFWGAQWAKSNALSGGPAPSSFKGFAATPETPGCGTAWSTDPGDSVPPPSGPLPDFMAVLVAGSASKSGSQISGDAAHVVIVQVAPGYEANPGHAGTGTVVATIC